MMMSYLLLAMMALAVAHFLYEEVIGPWLRTEAQFKLFAIRDELRMLKLKTGHEIDSRAYYAVQDSINMMIGHLPSFTPVAFVEAAHALEKNPELRARMDERAKWLDACAVADVKRLRKESLQVASDVFVINAGAWLIYILPAILLQVAIARIARLLKGLVLLPEGELTQVLPKQPTLGVVGGTP